MKPRPSRRLQRGIASDQSSRLAPRDDSQIAKDLDWRLKAPMNHRVNGDSAFFSRSEKATFAEILKLDPMSQVSGPKKSKTVAPRVSTVIPLINKNRSRRVLDATKR